ncbi:hypothetical protein [Bosea sp. 2RAB26]|uniref:hypothetical protein n=1 Tax=Bosea sp. 2RAB26 TaxID=3237476 RepID=UPI003F8EDD8D
MLTLTPQQEIDADASDKAGTGDFFCMDRRTFLEVAALGVAEMAVFIVISRGAGHPNRPCRWGVTAIEERTGLRWMRAKQVLDGLIASGIIQRTNEAKRQAAGVYRIAPWHDPETGEVGAGDLLYLPNSFVQGVDRETPPLKLLRQGARASLLRAAVLAYGEQNLELFSGIDWRANHGYRARKYRIAKRYSAGAHEAIVFEEDEQSPASTSWAFIERLGYGREKTKAAGQNFWSDAQTLLDLGLLTIVPHLVESEDSEILHPIDPLAGVDVEMRLAAASTIAAELLLPEGLARGLTSQGKLLAVVPRHMANVACVGIARLRYRAQTAMTSRWLARLNQDFDRWSAHYRGLTP